MSHCTFFVVCWAWGKQLRRWWRSHNDVVVWMWHYCVVPRSPRRRCYRTKTSGQRFTFRAGGRPFKTQRSVRGVYRFSPYRTENGLLPLEKPVLKAVTSLRRLVAGLLRRMPGFHSPVSPLRFMLDKVALGHVFCRPVLRLVSVSHLHVDVALTRRTNGWSVWGPSKSNALAEIVKCFLCSRFMLYMELMFILRIWQSTNYV